jgi:class 3 adenylate cyclase/CHASE2 domain-containing sensor protein
MHRKFLCGVLLIIFVGGGVEAAFRMGWLNTAENWYYDTWNQLAGLQYQPMHVVLVVIDDQMRLEHQDEPLVFWSLYFARAIATLRQAGARVIGLDILFSVSAESWLKKLKLPGNEQSRTFDLPFREQLASGKVVLMGTLVRDAQGKEKVLLPLPDYWGSLPGKLDDVGLANFYNDPDGVIRKFMPVLPGADGEAWVTFAQLLVERASAGGGAGDYPRLQPIGFVGPPNTIPRIPFRRLLLPGAEQDPQIRNLKDKVTIIAYEPSGIQDMHQTPYARGFLYIPARLMSGAEVHANIVETLLTGRAPRPVATPYRLVYLVTVLTVGTVLFFRLAPRPGLAALALLAVSIAVCAFVLFLSNLLLPTASLQLGLLIGYLGVLGLRLTGEERERTRLRQIFGRYVSEEVVEKLLATGRQPDLGGEALMVTVLFSDIRNFTSMSESLNPHEVVEMLNTYFSRVCEPILAQGGTVDKFIGDAVMAVFGSPVPHGDHARRALRAALAMAEKAREFRTWMERRFPNRGLPDFRIGIGVHTGEAVVGNIGSPQRFEFTAIGDTVNTASRLEGLTKELGWTIVASSDTIVAAGPGVVTGGRKEIRVKGRREAVAVAEVQSLEEDEPIREISARREER